MGRELDVPPNLSAQVWQAIMDEAKRSGTAGRRKVFAGMKVAIVGGSGGMGGLFAEVLKRAGAEVSIISRNARKGRLTAKRLGAEFAGKRATGFEDVVIVSVPLAETAGICIATAKEMKRGALLVEISSLKSAVLKGLRGKLPDGIEFLSVHPLFGPLEAEFAGQKFAVIKTKPGKRGRAFLQGLRKLGAQVFFVSAEKHDKAMATVQVMHYLALLALAKAVYLLRPERRLFTQSYRETLSFLNEKKQKMGSASLAILLKHPDAATGKARLRRIAERISKMDARELARAMRNLF